MPHHEVSGSMWTGRDGGKGGRVKEGRRGDCTASAPLPPKRWVSPAQCRKLLISLKPLCHNGEPGLIWPSLSQSRKSAEG